MAPQKAGWCWYERHNKRGKGLVVGSQCALNCALKVFCSVPSFVSSPLRLSCARGNPVVGCFEKLLNLVWACSEEANWITGQLIDVDGGASLMDAHLPLEIQEAVPRVAKAA